jgi:molybdopterin-guanine dinucleotide biosynthesis protein B
MTAVVSVVGRSNVGKTTFIVKLIEELKRLGYRVGTIKHFRHEFEIDQPGKDSWRHARAGSDVAVIAGPQKMVYRLERELGLWEIVALMGDLDIVVTEGYKGADAPKIEVYRLARNESLACDPSELVALVTDRDFETDVPQFGLDDAAGVASWIAERFIGAAPGSAAVGRGEYA